MLRENAVKNEMYNAYCVFLDHAIRRQRQAIRFRVAWSLSLASLGVTIMILGMVFLGAKLEEYQKVLIATAGTFLASLAGFPINELFSRKEKMAALGFIRNRLKIATQEGHFAEAERLKNQIAGLVEKSLGV